MIKTYAKSFAVFLAMLYVTKKIVAPAAAKAKLPILSDLV